MLPHRRHQSWPHSLLSAILQWVIRVPSLYCRIFILLTLWLSLTTTFSQFQIFGARGNMEEREDGLTRRQDLTERHSSLGLPLLNMNRKRREQHAEERSRGENQLHGIYTVPENTAAPARMNNSSTVKEPPLVEPIWKKLPYRIQNVYTDTSTEEEEAPAPIKPHPNGYYVTTLAGNPLMNGGYRDGKGANAHFDTPGGSVGVDKHDGVVYLADSYNQRIRKIRPNGETTTIAGTFYRG